MKYKINLTIGLLAIILFLAGCNYRHTTTYVLWTSTKEEQFVMVPKDQITHSEIEGLKENNIKFYQGENGEYYIERKPETGEVVGEYVFKTLATPFTLVVDGVIVSVYIIVSTRGNLNERF